MKKKIFRQILKEIKKYNTIVIARHIGADPDALASQLALKEIIIDNFLGKTVYAVGSPASKFKYLGSLDKFNEEMYKDSLLIVTDTPDKKRVDDVDVTKFKSVIKIDHHPFVENFNGIEYIDDTASSACQIIIDFAKTLNLNISLSAAEKLYVGIISDTNRFLFSYTTPDTFDLVSYLIKKTNINFTSLYDNLYMRTLKELKFQSYIINNFLVTPHKFAYVKLTDEILKEYDVDAATAGNMVNDFNYIDDFIAWGVFTEDKNNNFIRGSLRSRGPIVNEVAAKFGGGGHKYASGVRLINFELVDELVKAMDIECSKYEN
ncbi:MAG: bifunctional oligoribonuclease/PAP phosphatase NrnA [Clostridium sp.]|nr:bifunctional oligoribonuclease/PAP phosphatase NrnA [Clostridium sp.]MCM1444741.1 bifunctional oligoribonuclease/PAP phosphatase NrnA [Candidatus Amulumruptor caecigallinarius]